MSDSGEKTGVITFVNSWDYTPQIGPPLSGCFVVIDHDAGQTVVWTKSQRLQNTLEMAFAGKVRVTVDYQVNAADSKVPEDHLSVVIRRAGLGGTIDGPYILNYMWTAN